jgi:hypothetical protein
MRHGVGSRIAMVRLHLRGLTRPMTFSLSPGPGEGKRHGFGARLAKKYG